jgi:hypothetical protein
MLKGGLFSMNDNIKTENTTDGVIDTVEELINREVNVSFFNRSFWDLWLQKMFRNIASMKFQLLIILYIPIIWGMFHTIPNTNEPWISSVVGLGFLGGAYITLATGRLISQSSLVEKVDKNHLDTDS